MSLAVARVGWAGAAESVAGLAWTGSAELRAAAAEALGGFAAAAIGGVRDSGRDRAPGGPSVWPSGDSQAAVLPPEAVGIRTSVVLGAERCAAEECGWPRSSLSAGVTRAAGKRIHCKNRTMECQKSNTSHLV